MCVCVLAFVSGANVVVVVVVVGLDGGILVGFVSYKYAGVFCPVYYYLFYAFMCGLSFRSILGTKPVLCRIKERFTL